MTGVDEMGNQIKTTFLLAVMTIFLVLIGRLIGGQQGMVVALVLAAGMNFFSYWYSDKMVLKMYRARALDPKQEPDLYEMIRKMALRGGLPVPRVYVIPQDTPNAFATGRNPEHAVIAVTQGLLKLLNRDELEGVLAHELAHVKNRDILVCTIAATMAGAVMMLASMARWSAVFGGLRGNDDEGGGLGMIGLIAMSVIAPIGAMIIQMAISRSREYLADETGALLANHPEGLARALEKLDAYSRRLPMNANPSTAHLFIVNPLSGGSMMHLFSTHPPPAERIARLRGRKVEQDPSGGSGDKRHRDARDFWNRLSR